MRGQKTRTWTAGEDEREKEWEPEPCELPLVEPKPQTRRIAPPGHDPDERDPEHPGRVIVIDLV